MYSSVEYEIIINFLIFYRLSLNAISVSVQNIMIKFTVRVESNFIVGTETKTIWNKTEIMFYEISFDFDKSYAWWKKLISSIKFDVKEYDVIVSSCLLLVY